MTNNNAVYNSVIVCPQVINYNGSEVGVLDLSFEARCLDNGDGTYMTLGEYEQKYGYKFPRSVDGRYIALYVALSDVNNELTRFKQLLTSCGVTLGGNDYTQTDGNLAWLLLLQEFTNDFMQASELFKSDDTDL